MLDAWSAACLALGACPWQVRELLTEICFLHGIARTENSCDFAARPRVFLSFPCVELLGFGLLTVVVREPKVSTWAVARGCVLFWFSQVPVSHPFLWLLSASGDKIQYRN